MNLLSIFGKEFPEIPLNEREKLTSFSTLKKYKKGDEIMKINEEAPDELYFILNGVVRGYGIKNELETINLYFIIEKNFFLSPDRFFNGLGQTSRHGFEAVTDAQLLCINFSQLLEHCGKSSDIFNFYNEAISTMLKGFSERIKLMLIEDASKRYQHLFNTRPEIIDYAQNKHISEFLGITPNSLSRILSSKFK